MPSSRRRPSTRRPTSRRSTRSSRPKSANARKVRPGSYALAAWDILQKKMSKLGLSEAEQEFLKQDILHKEAEINRKM